MIYIPDGADPASVQVPTEPARKVASTRSMTPGQLARFLLGLIWEEGTKRDVDKQTYYEDRMRVIGKRLADELEDIRRAKAYRGEGGYDETDPELEPW